ncbi:hypothetical protein C2S52_017917 [Perilla frutescens var. hirtella]|nr:hypothetical protein C2S52_017917 [Perilla frutescens var. hirtella]KAH6811671.1 hypothetical protein C2S51_025433 [Perilla frutescens var. frutescens]
MKMTLLLGGAALQRVEAARLQRVFCRRLGAEMRENGGEKVGQNLAGSEFISVEQFSGMYDVDDRRQKQGGEEDDGGWSLEIRREMAIVCKFLPRVFWVIIN